MDFVKVRELEDVDRESEFEEKVFFVAMRYPDVFYGGLLLLIVSYL